MRYDDMNDEQVLEFKKSEARRHRDARLKATDKYMLPDFPITEEQREELIKYREALRMFPLQKGFPDTELPERPEFIK